MNDYQNEHIEKINNQQLTPAVPSLEQSVAKPSKKKRSTLAITTAFMAGALTYALISGGYNFYLKTQENELLRSEAQAQTQGTPVTQPLTPTQQTKISDEEVSQSVVNEDCLLKSEYSELVLKGSKMKITSIDLYDGIQASNGSTGGNARWSATPAVTDYKCETIKITDLKVGDRVNVFVSKTSSGMLDTRMLQKATK